MENQERGNWGSNFGFLMAAIGSAVGLGNIWGFPYKMGMNGGFAFLLVYVILVIFVGMVVMLGEFVLGRRSGRSAVGAYASFSKKHAWVGGLGVISGFCILAFYSVLGGMVLRYAIAYALQLVGLDGFAGQGSGFFGYLLYDEGGMIFFLVLFTIINMLIVQGGIQGGIEKFTSIAMPALFAIIVFIIIYVAMQPGSADGYAFMFSPNFEPFSTFEGFLSVLKSAAGQMFFSLSLGMGNMITYGSYLSKKEDLQKNAIIIPVADSMMALMAGMIVLPACAAFGVDYGAGPGLLFVSMQEVFTNMGDFGNFMGFMFYFLVFIAALTSSISLLEVVTAFQIDRDIDKGKTPNRKKVSLIYAAMIFVLGIPVALDALGGGGATVLAPYEILGLTTDSAGYAMWNDCWLDLYDFIAEGVLMPLGALIMSVLIGWVYGIDVVKAECEECGKPMWGYKFFNICFKYIVPVAMAFVLYAQVTDFIF